MFLNFFKKNYEAVLQLIIVIIIICVYACSIHYSFLEGWDDQAYVTQNSFITLTFHNILYWFTHAPVIGGYTPLTIVSFMIDHAVWGLNKTGYHIQNIFWHIFATLIIFRIFIYFNISPIITFFLCLIFAVHPQRIESVVWISERKDVLCASFYFLSIYLFLKNFREDKIPVTVFILFICALLSKPMAYSLPFILIICDFYKTKKLNVKYYFFKYWKLIIILIPYGIATILTQSHGFVIDKLSIIKRIYIVLFNYLWYIKTTFIPVNLAPVYSRVSIKGSIYWIIAAYILIIILIIFLLLKYRKITIDIILPIIFTYIISLIPVCGIFLIGVFDHADRFSYIPSTFLWFSVGILINGLFIKIGKKYHLKFLLISSTLLFIYLVFMLSLNSAYIESFKSLYNMNKASCRESIQTPNAIVLQKFGINEIAEGNYNNALNIANRLVALVQSDSLTLEEKDACVLSAGLIRCLAYYYLGEKEKTIDLFEKISPFFSRQDDLDKLNYIQLLAVVTDCYYSKGNSVKALETCNKIINLSTKNSYNYFYYKGLNLFYLRKYDLAVPYFKNALKYNPGDKNALKHLSLCRNKYSQCVS